jgi:hypothetical protein
MLKVLVSVSISWLNGAGFIGFEMDPPGSRTIRIHLKADFSLHSSTGSSDAEKRLTPPQGGVFLCLQGCRYIAEHREVRER